MHMMFSFAEHLKANAPFLVAWAPVALAGLLGAIIWSAVSSLLKRRVSPKDEDNYVFMDTDPSLDDHPPSTSTDEEEKDHIPYSHAKYSEQEMLQRAVGFYKDMNSRRSVRDFSDKPVPLDVIKRIIHTAGTSPSGAHTEPWTYVVISNKAVKTQVRQIIEDEEEINYAKRMGQSWVEDLKVLRTSWEKPYLETAPYIVVVFKQSYGTHDDGSRKVHYYNELSIAISVGIMLCAIQNAGLVTVTSTPMNSGPRLRTLLNRPANEKVVLLLPIGFAAADATVPDFKRKPIDDIMVSV